MPLSEELRGQADEFLLFVPIHGMDRSSKPCGPSSLDLNEHQHIAVLRHKVQLSQRRANVFGDDAVALTAQIALGLRLSFLPKESPGVKNCHTLVRCVPAVRGVAGRG